jgi:hypothetical protein
MIRATSLLRITVIACSVLLAPGFIGFRSGALDWLIGNNKPGTTEALSGSDTQRERAIMNSSKEMYLPSWHPRANPQTSTAEKTEQPPAILPKK